MSISITNKNTIWIGGDREIAYHKKGKWFLITYPNTNWAITNIYGDDNNHVWAQIFILAREIDMQKQIALT